jgi:hypothetical protein
VLQAAGMSSLNHKIAAEVRMRELLEEWDLPRPDSIEYGFTCIRLFWSEPKLVLVIDLDSEDGLESVPEAG